MTPSELFSNLANQSLFIVWGPPSHGPRSQVFARELGIRELHFLEASSRRGTWAALVKYPLQATRTLSLLFRKRPKLVYVQSPPGLAVFFVYLYCVLTKSHFVVDAHSAAMQLPVWTRPRWFWSWLARKAITTIVTNEHFEQTLRNWGANVLVIPDIPTTFPRSVAYPLNGGDFHVTVVNTFSADEPLAQVLEAVQGMEGVKLHVTGRLSRGNPEVIESAPKNVHFTDFLSNEQYYALMRASHAVMCLTTRDHTMQRGACEALSMGKPIITSHWPLLRAYFRNGTVHVDNTSESIKEGVEKMKLDYDCYLSGIQQLQASQRAQWEEKTRDLAQLIRSALEA